MNRLVKVQLYAKQETSSLDLVLFLANERTSEIVHVWREIIRKHIDD